METASGSRASASSAYATRGGGIYQASLLTRGGWHPDHQHGGPPVALACRAIEQAAAEHGLTHVSRLTANLPRPVPVGEVEVTVCTDYAGRNAGHYSATVFAGGKQAVRLTALVQRENEVALPDGAQDRSLPEAPPGPEQAALVTLPFAGDQTGYGDLVETRCARGRFFGGPCAVWFRLRHPLLDAETPSAYQRVAVAADSGNGISAVLDYTAYSFINCDLTINLLRRPQGEWICLDARTHLGPDGCGLAEATLYDTRGLIGKATQCLSLRPRSP